MKPNPLFTSATQQAYSLIPRAEHRAFKAMCIKNNTTVSRCIHELIKKYMAEQNEAEK